MQRQYLRCLKGIVQKMDWTGQLADWTVGGLDSWTHSNAGSQKALGTRLDKTVNGI